jgi:hemerythrin-like domain-containing protein
MIHPVETLMNEHRVIERGLDSLDDLCAGASTADPAVRSRLVELVRFFREYADRVHHAKEEDRLFTALAAHGFSSESGPVFVMLSEHEAGRAHVSRLAEVAGGDGPLSPEEEETVREHGAAFSVLLRGHIQKEDNILFPMAAQVLQPPAVAELRAAFDAFDATAALEELQSLVND